MSLITLTKHKYGTTIQTTSWDTVTKQVTSSSVSSSASVADFELAPGTFIEEYCSGTTLVTVTYGGTIKFTVGGKWMSTVKYSNLTNAVACGYEGPLDPGEDDEFIDVPTSYLEEGGLTMSYQTDLKSWTAEHSYHPNWMVSNGSKLYMTEEQDESIHLHNVGEYGTYLNKGRKDLEIEFVINKYPVDTKAFDNFIIHTDSKDEYDTFKTLQVFNNTQNTGELTVFVPKSFAEMTMDMPITNIILQKVSNEFRCTIPPDLVNDAKGDIFTSNNLVSSSGFSEEERLFRPRMKGKFIVARLTYDNNQYFQFFTIKTNFRPVAR